MAGEGAGDESYEMHGHLAYLSSLSDRGRWDDDAIHHEDLVGNPQDPSRYLPTIDAVPMSSHNVQSTLMRTNCKTCIINTGLIRVKSVKGNISHWLVVAAYFPFLLDALRPLVVAYISCFWVPLTLPGSPRLPKFLITTFFRVAHTVLAGIVAFAITCDMRFHQSSKQLDSSLCGGGPRFVSITLFAGV